MENYSDTWEKKNVTPIWAITLGNNKTFNSIIYLSEELQVLQSKHTQHTGTHPHRHTRLHSRTHTIEPEILTFCIDQSLVVAIVKAMSISGIVK